MKDFQLKIEKATRTATEVLAKSDRPKQEGATRSNSKWAPVYECAAKLGPNEVMEVTLPAGYTKQSFQSSLHNMAKKYPKLKELVVRRHKTARNKMWVCRLPTYKKPGEAKAATIEVKGFDPLDEEFQEQEAQEAQEAQGVQGYLFDKWSK
jgi:hypothetical protein